MSKKPKDQTFDELVILERQKQDQKWGEQNHYPVRWITILGEEFGELCNATLEGNQTALEKELIQVAAVCKAMWESGKRNNWL